MNPATRPETRSIAIIAMCIAALLAGSIAHTVSAQSPRGGDATPAAARGVVEPDEEIVVTPMPNPVLHGGQLTLTLKVQNLSPSDAVDSANVTTTTPEGTTFLSASTTKGEFGSVPPAGGTGDILCQIGPLGKLERQTVTIVLTVTAMPGTSISTQATVEPNDQTRDTRQFNNTGRATIQVIAPSVADLAVTVSPDADAAATGSLFTYVITATNLSAPAARPAAPHDPAPGVLLTTATPDGTAFSSAAAGQATIDAPDVGGSGPVVFNLGTLDPGASTSVVLTVAVAAEPGATLDLGVRVTSTAIDSNPGNDEASATTPVENGSSALVAWEAPDANGTEPLPPPQRLVVTPGAAPGFSLDMGAKARAPEVLGYNVYRSNQPNVAVIPGNLLTSVPPSQTSTNGSVAPGGTFFVVTAVYENGESGPSNEGSADVPSATLTKVKVGSTKISAKGTGFSDAVTVLLDGIPFVSAALVKSGNTKVVQRSTLLTGQTIGDYLAAHPTVLVGIRNANGGIATYRFTH
jgi:uncharacterized repeat protein (TIGR01451 family)